MGAPYSSTTSSPPGAIAYLELTKEVLAHG